MSKIHLYKKVIQERRKGVSIGDIAKAFALSKGTVSSWCKDIHISDTAKERIRLGWLRKTAPARLATARNNKLQKKLRIEYEASKARDIVGKISDRDLLIAGVALYWAEGSKKEAGSGFNIINSDPMMIQTICRWLIHSMNVPKNDIVANVVINVVHRNRDSELLNFWSNLLDLPKESFRNTTFIRVPHKRVYNNHSEYFGMLRVKVKNSAWLRRRVVEMIKIIQMPA